MAEHFRVSRAQLSCMSCFPPFIQGRPSHKAQVVALAQSVYCRAYVSGHSVGSYDAQEPTIAHVFLTRLLWLSHIQADRMASKG